MLPDLVDFTDFYATFADAAQHKTTGADPIDGRSFFAQLSGRAGDLRDWVLCHYQCYWKQTPGQYARTANYKLYRDGRYYEVPVDLDESKDIAGVSNGKAAEIQRELRHLLDRCPPVPAGRLGRDTKKRPLHPETPALLE